MPSTYGSEVIGDAGMMVEIAGLDFIGILFSPMRSWNLSKLAPPRLFPLGARSRCQRSRRDSMKKNLSLVLRILFAAAGVAYIAVTLTWTDHIVVPAQTRLPNGVITEKPTPFKVIEGDLIDTEGKLLIRLDEQTVMPVERSLLGAGIDDYRSKPGVNTTLSHANFSLLLLGLLLVGPIYLVQTYRWWLLMRARGIDCTLGKSFRLTMVGSFFNYCMPGTTGGDLVKAYYAARNSDRRADAVMTVIFDRITGLLGLVVLGGVAGLIMVLAMNMGWIELNESQARIVRTITSFIWAGMLAATLGAIIYFSSRVRKKLGITPQRIGKLPGARLLLKIDEAALAYKQHIGVVLGAAALSLPVHLALAGATAIAGYALGINTPFGLLVTVLPVLFLAAAVPLTYQGLGVMEGLGKALIVGVTATENQLIGMLLMIRFYQIFYSLLGSLFLLKGDIHMHPERETTPQESDASDAPITANAAAV